ncbi:MAG: hypothetical protein FWF43_07890 [Propionibacteriaceae bacterium]|nr:hypothetical protein [Propionibacteriaceae bacterium]
MKKKPGNAGFIAGAVLLVMCFIGIANSLGGSSATPGTTIGGVADQPSHPTDSSVVDLTLQAVQTYGIWFSQGSGDGAHCGVEDPSGNILDFDTSVTPQVVGDYTLEATFKTTTGGKYSVACQTAGAAFTYKVGSTDNTVTVGTTSTTSDIPVEVGRVVGSLFVFGAGLALLIVTGVRRSKWSRQNSSFAASAGNYGAPTYGPTGAQPAYQPAGYPSGTTQPGTPQPLTPQPLNAQPGTSQPDYGPGPSVPPQTSSFAPPPEEPGAPSNQPPSHLGPIARSF